MSSRTILEHIDPVIRRDKDLVAGRIRTYDPAAAGISEDQFPPAPRLSPLHPHKFRKPMRVSVNWTESPLSQTRFPIFPGMQVRRVENALWMRSRRNFHYSWQIIGANRSKSEGTSPRTPVGPVSCFFGTYTVDETAKTYTVHLERCTFPQWDGIDGTNNIAMPTENELIVTTTTPIQDPTMGAFVPHINFKRAK